IIGFTYCSKGPDPYTVVPDPQRVPQGLKYYSAEMHKAAFVLPQFAQKHIVRK
ncbi:polyamine aminopropyltransferase, partial [Leptospira interrogans]